MLIRTVCPRCQTTFQVQQELRGKAMRCPVSTCQKVFPIVEASAAPPAASPPPTNSAPPSRQSGGVGDVVPLLPGELTAPSSGPSLVPMLPAEPAASWRDAAPPVRGGAGQKAAAPPPAITPRPKREPAAPTAKPARSGPIVKEAGDWAAPPPVRRGQSSAEAQKPEPVTTITGTPGQPTPARPAHARLAKWIIIPFALLTVVGLAGGGLYVYWIFNEREDYLARKAAETYDNGTFRVAASDYAQLAKLYPDSEKVKFYQFRAELAKLRYAAKEDDDLRKILEQFAEFMKAKEKDPLLEEHAADVGNSLVQVTAGYAEEAAKDPKDRAPLDVITQAEAVIAQAREIRAKGGKEPPDWAKAEAAFSKLRESVALALERQDVFASLDKLAATGTYASLQAAEELLASKAERFPNLADDPQTKNRILSIYKKHLESVKFTEATGVKVVAPAEETEPALVFDPLVDGTAGTPRRGTPVALALARGVLYGLDRDTGRVRWAMRVGIDTTTLPSRVSAGDGNRERILALSSDTRTLTALDSEGAVLWRYAMQHPCLGRPLVVENRAYLAALNGDVHEIELIQGKLLGTYSLGQRLTQGGTHEPSTGRVYFPADDGCVYVINVKSRTCESILYSRHPAGSLRGEVILVGPEEDAPGYLILPQATGLDAVELRVFKLPIENQFDQALSLAAQHPVTPPARLNGWTWFRPYHDAEKLAMLSDTGMLGLFGIRQKRNRDQALFPMLPAGGLRVAPLLGVKEEEADQRGRAEVVQMQGDDVWVLASNRIQRLKLAWDRDSGPRLIAAWPTTGRTREVGSPLHAAQSFEDDTGKTNLVVVTQPPRRPAVWASCLDDESGELRWRRQLGVVCEGEPLSLAAKGKEPLLMVLDQSGSMFSIDPSRYKVNDDTQWISDEKLTRLGESLDENPDQPPVVLRIDESSAYVVACPGEGKELVVRHVQADAGERRLKVKESKIALPAPLAGTPAVVGSRLILPLANERLARLPLPVNDASPGLDTSGPTWKSTRAEPEARCHIVALGGDRFLTTDGIRQLRVWEWPASVRWVAVPKSRGNQPSIEMSDRIVSAPLLLPGKEKQLVVADSAGVLHLLEVEDDGRLAEKRKWSMGGPMVAEPYVEMVDDEARVGCVGRGKLMWIDPTKAETSWTYETANQARIVGRPRVVAGMVVVADQAGRYVGLDPKKGKPMGPGYQLKGSIAPATGVAAFSDDRLMAPASDGTLLLLGVKRLKGK